VTPPTPSITLRARLIAPHAGRFAPKTLTDVHQAKDATVDRPERPGHRRIEPNLIGRN
jgi:hypothetical protein